MALLYPLSKVTLARFFAAPLNCHREHKDIQTITSMVIPTDYMLVLYQQQQLLKRPNKTNKQTNNVETGLGRSGLYAPKN